MNILLLLGLSKHRRIERINETINTLLKNVKDALRQRRVQREIIVKIIDKLNRVLHELEELERSGTLVSLAIKVLKQELKLIGCIKQAKDKLSQPYIGRDILKDVRNLVEKLDLGIESLRRLLLEKLSRETNITTSNKYVQHLKEALKSTKGDQSLQLRSIKARLITPGVLGTRTFPWAIGFHIGLHWDPLIQSPYYPATAIRGAIHSLLFYPDLIKKVVEDALETEVSHLEALCYTYEVLGVAEWDKDLPNEVIDRWKGCIRAEAADLLKLLKKKLGEKFIGKVMFFDAYPVEVSEEGLLIIPEVISPHYRETEVRRLLETDQKVIMKELHKKLPEIQEITEPRALLFPAIAPGVTFTFYIASENEKLLRVATALLKCALTTVGIGAKTTSGYNLFEITEDEANT